MVGRGVSRPVQPMPPADQGPEKPQHPQPPRPVQLARQLWIVSAAVGLVRSLFQLADREALVAQIREIQPQLTQDQVDQAVNGSVVLTLLFVAALFGLYVLLANRMRSGRNWARVVLTVFGAATVLLGVFGLLGLVSGAAATLGETVSPLNVLVSIVVVALEATAVVLMYRPESNRYFLTMTRQGGPR